MNASYAGGRIRGTLLALTAGCALFAFGCVGSSSSLVNGGGSPPQPAAAAAVSVCDAAGANCQTTNAALSASTADDIKLVVNWTNVPQGTHTQEIRMLLPNGNFYQHFDSSFLINPSSSGQANVKRMVAIQGTPIAERLLTGAWKVQVLLDDQVVSEENLQINP